MGILPRRARAGRLGGGGDVRDGSGARRRLAARRRALEQALAALRQGGLGQSQGEGLSELSSYDNHPGDLGTETWQRGQQVGRAQDLERDLATVAEAEAALDRGRYGVCGRCGRTIPRARLAARPEALTCVGCQEAAEAEAAALGPQGQAPAQPLGGQERRAAGGFDPQDAWQMVAQYGSSGDTHSGGPGGGVADLEEPAGPD